MSSGVRLVGEKQHGGGSAMRADFRLLGDVEVLIDDRPVEVGHARQRCVLVALLLEANRPVPPDRLLERVWAGRHPHRARNVLSGYLSRLRQVLADADGVSISRQPGGYVLTTDPSAVDVHRFHDLVAAGRAADDLCAAVQLLTEALRCWRGEAFATLDTPWLNEVRDALDAERFAAELDRNDLALRAGRHSELIVEIASRVGAHPLDERLVGQLMLALYRNGRQADALTAFHDVRNRLLEELGADPGPALQDLHQQILSGDAALTVPQAEAKTDAARRTVPHQLPAPLRKFSGRTRELAELDDLLDRPDGEAGTVISTVTGSGGIGKTTLVVHWAHQNVNRFPDGQLYINLRGFDPSGTTVAPAEAIRGFLEALGVHSEQMPTTDSAQMGLYRSLLAGKRILVVLDNAQDVKHVRPLLPGAPGCLALVTSRNQLTGLTVSDGALPLPLDVLSVDEARALLADRTGAQRIGAEPQAVDDIIALCGRLPLALAIVAARAASSRNLRLDVLVEQLRTRHGRLDALEVGDEAVDVRAVFSWSYLALSPESSRSFRLMGIHPGPAISAAAAASIAGCSLAVMRGLLAELTQANLLTEHAPAQYVFHDLLRAYANELFERVEPAAERSSAMARLFHHYLHTASAADERLYPHREHIDIPEPVPGVIISDIADEHTALDWFTKEERALAAMTRLCTTGNAGVDGAGGWQLAYMMVNFLDRRGEWFDWIDIHEGTVKAAIARGDRRGQGFAQRGLQRANLRMGRLDEADEHGSYALQAFTDLGNVAGQAQTELIFGGTAIRRGDDEAAVAHSLRAQELYAIAGHEAGQANALNNAGFAYALLGQHERCIELCSRAVSILHEIGDRFVEGGTWDSLGYAHHHLKNHSAAITSFENALRLFREQGARHSEASTTLRLGDTYRAAGDEVSARRSWLHALEIFEQLGHPDLETMRGNITVRLAKIRPSSGWDERAEIGP